MKVTWDIEQRAACVAEVVALHQLVWQAIEDGRIDSLAPDPTYPRMHLFTDEKVAGIARKIEKELYGFELANYPGWHRSAQGIDNSEVLVSPGFDQMPLSAQWFLILGMDEIYQRYRLSPGSKSGQYNPKLGYVGYRPETGTFRPARRYRRSR